MLLLVCGLLVWSMVHLIPGFAIPVKKTWINAVGEKAYPATFALLIVASLVMIVLGWRSIIPEYYYVLPPVFRNITIALMLISILFIGATSRKTVIKRFIRHPQLTGVVLWSIAHLLSNGETRSIVLFGWIGIWALIEMLAINKREGQWMKPDAPSMAVEIRGLLITFVIFVALMFAHPYFAGRALF